MIEHALVSSLALEPLFAAVVPIGALVIFELSAVVDEPTERLFSVALHYICMSHIKWS